ncbi:MAG: tRNA (adenosine(37)-N6)-threonylcarbamoyltransferase complex dimerization subunit type 1 TsaB [Candidatus Omnitrophica bacterium]|nr:tRNA (adenosine(37)-N6)-threonylcarbamoyltransferase complex dimerization subunit type 1 TsaB [Candidatus Omnitrophota bacterium]
MNILSIDTSTDYLSIAVTRDAKALSKVHKKVPMMHSSLLVPTIKTVMARGRVRLRDLDGFCISIGPGSFTGLRIGVTTVKGLSYVYGKPVAEVPTLDVIAYNAIHHKGFICPVLDARKGKVYACIYSSDGRSLKRVSKYLLITLDELALKLKKYNSAILMGDMAGRLGPVDKPFFGGDWHPRAEIVARLGLELFKNGKTVGSSELEPMYIYSRECDIKGR